jgi:hypothetical protein
MRRALDYSKARELAVKAQVDPRSILVVYRGGRVRGMAGHRAREALIAAGFLTPREPPPSKAA